MKDKKLVIWVLILLLFLDTSLAAQAKIITKIVFSDSADVDYGYIWVIVERTPDKYTGVTIDIVSDELVDFWIGDVGASDNYIDGQDISVYEWEKDVHSGSFIYALIKRQRYEFVIENSNIVMADAYVSLTISFTYTPSFLWIIYIIIGVIAVAGFITLLLQSYKKRKLIPSSYFTMGKKSTSKTYDNSTQNVSAPQGSELTKFCNYCGSIIESDANFCTNCGSEYSS